jgi:hypothetical protein
MEENSKPKRELKLSPIGENGEDIIFTNSAEELKQRFLCKKIEDFLNDNIKPFPTLIMEEEDPKFLELLRPFILYGNIKPFTSRDFKPPTRECLERLKIKDYGELYGLIIPN